jgi:hypothetical protein
MRKKVNTIISNGSIDTARLDMEPHPLTLSQRERVRNEHDEIETSSYQTNKGGTSWQ